MKDIRIGRELTVRPLPSVLTTSVPQQLVAANSTRVGLGLTALQSGAATGLETAQIGILNGADFQVVWSLTYQQPSVYFDVARFGSVATGRLYVLFVNGEAPTIAVVSYELIEEPQE